MVPPADDIGTNLRDRRRRNLKSIPGAACIVQIRQDALAVHVQRRSGDLWTYTDFIDMGETLVIKGAGSNFPWVFDRSGARIRKDQE